MVARIVLSLMIAFGLWAFVINERDPDQTVIEPGIQIVVDGLQDDFQIVDPLPPVDVTLKGPQSIVQGISVNDIEATVDMADVDAPGIYERNVKVQTPGGFRDVDVEPSSVTVEIGSVVSETFDITIVEPDDSPATLTSIRLSTSSVTLVGVERNVDNVERVELEIELGGRTESFTYTAQVTPIGADGMEINDDTIEVRPESVEVSVEFEMGSRSVPVIVQCACPTDDGGVEIRDLLSATAIPPTVRIEGPQPLITDIDAVRTVPISVANVEVSGFVTGAVDLDSSSLPEGVTIGPSAVGVYVQVELSAQELIQQEIQIINPPPDMLVDVSSTLISFELQGPAEALATLSESPPVAIIDLAGYDEGVYTLSPRIALPPDVRVVNLEPGTIEVTIERPPPPSPSPTSAPAPTVIPDSTTTTSAVPTRRVNDAQPAFSDTIN